MQEIADWLKKLGVSEYAERFAQNDIEINVLADLTDQHVNTPPPKGGGFRLRLKAGLVRLRRTWRQLR
jgi:hypothetical protein